MAELQAPVNRLVGIVRIVLDHLITGLGASLAIAAATAYAPWLAWPFIRQIFGAMVNHFALVLDQDSFKLAAKFIIRFQNEGRLKEFQTAMEPFFKPEPPSEEEIKKAKDAIDRLVHRARP